MKYFNPSYWFKLWVLSAPLFNDKTQGINAKSIDNKKIKDWVSNNTSLDLINQEISFTNSNITNQLYNLNQVSNQNINPIYQAELETSTHKHRHEKTKHKRTLNGGNEIEFEAGFLWFAINAKMFASFKPQFWEEIIELYGKNSLHDFKIKFADKMFNGVWMDSRIETCDNMKSLAEVIYSNWSKINHIWENSDRKKRIRITVGDNQNYITTSIKSDENYYSNWYLNNLKYDFANYDNPEINLGIINNNYENDIKNAIKEKYQNFDISQIEIVEKNDYLHFSQDYSFKIKIKDSSEKYSHGILKPKFTYITQTKLNEISNYIANDSKVKQWIKHINDYNKNLPTKIENLKSYTDSQKWTAKNTEREIIKGYIRDWSYVHTLIEHDLKLDELNKNVQGLKSSFDSIKNQVNDLDNRVQNLENVSGWNCANTVAFAGGVISLVPVVGSVGSAVATMTSSACAIAGV